MAHHKTVARIEAHHAVRHEVRHEVVLAVAHHVLLGRRIVAHSRYPDQVGRQYTVSCVEAGHGLVHRRTDCAGVGYIDHIGNLKKHVKADRHIGLVVVHCCATTDIAHVVVPVRCGWACRMCQWSVHLDRRMSLQTGRMELGKSDEMLKDYMTKEEPVQNMCLLGSILQMNNHNLAGGFAVNGQRSRDLHLEH